MIIRGSHRGFTLIEIIVVMAVISILTGIMIPMIYRVWESNEEDITRQRMRDLKVAMVGDFRLTQNGARTSFGYAGDVGELPSTLHNLIMNDDGVANWNGPYLPAGYDAAKFAVDAWGRNLIYVTSVSSGRILSATLTSYGPDGIASTADDIADSEFQTTATEVAPLDTIQGNVQVTFSTAPTSSYAYSLGVRVQRKDRTGAVTTSLDLCCSGVISTTTNTANVQVNYAQSYTCSIDSDSRLSIGMLYLTPRIFAGVGCGSLILNTSSSELSATASSNTLFANLQIQNVAP